MFDALKTDGNAGAGESFEFENEPAADAEVFSLERLESLARELATTQKISAGKKDGFDLLARLEDNKLPRSKLTGY